MRSLGSAGSMSRQGVVPQPKEAMQSVYVVFTVSMNRATGAQLSKQILGIFDNEGEAEQLEEAFKKMQRETPDVAVQIFTTRYALPYVIPIMKEAMGRTRSR